MTDKEKILAFLEGMSKGCCPNETKEIIINKIIPWIKDLPEEPVSEDLEKAAMMHFKDVMEDEVKTGIKPAYMTSFKAGAKWQKEHSFSDSQINENIIYAKGYKQAEKDLTLTWEDISIIRKIMFDYNKQIRNEMAIPKEEEYCKEVLKRFLEQKGELV